MQKEVVVIALGGNAIKQEKEAGTFEEQFGHVNQTANEICKIHKLGYKLVITHGNGPQAGNLLIQQEEGQKYVPAQPLDCVGAMTQGQIGWMMQMALQNHFVEQKIPLPIACVLTQVLVKGDDPDFKNPTKPVGPFYSQEEAEKYQKDKGYIVKNVKPTVPKGWRRVVPSPEPMEIIESAAINKLIEAGAIVICSGGGGIPVERNDKGILKGIEAVIDKDKAGNVLAQSVKADIFLILTDVEFAFIDFGKKTQKACTKMTVAEAEKLYDEGHFSKGSMGPKVQAAARFVKAGGKKSIITSLEKAHDALLGKTGTVIVPN